MSAPGRALRGSSSSTRSFFRIRSAMSRRSLSSCRMAVLERETSRLAKRYELLGLQDALLAFVEHARLCVLDHPTQEGVVGLALRRQTLQTVTDFPRNWDCRQAHRQ